MQSRRDFLHMMAVLSGAAAGAAGAIFEPLEKALAIEPEAGSTYLDAEHVVILMQENRSFDHAYGTLQGVRGFNDPRAIELPNGNPVWAQSNKAAETYLPFHLDIKESKTTWMGCLPHGWADQVDAANGGKHDRWLDTKRSGHKEYADMPLTLGYHTREDIPFYYALADAFTIGDQNFCSTLTGTTPNRLHLWTGTIREKPDPSMPALVRNEDCEYGSWCSWRTFPELLEDHGVSWKIYQNELSVPSSLVGEADSWLGNFGDNPIEWFTQFGVRYYPKHREYLERAEKTVAKEFADLMATDLTSKPEAEAKKLRDRQTQLKASLARITKDRAEFTEANFEKLSPRQKSLYARAFVTNMGDPAYRELSEIRYREGDKTHLMQAPKGDVLYQFRKDVNEGALPTVSWLVPPERFSDHPCSAWYGQWYLSEVLNILTQKPEVWKKTIFILTYDENDGYFDHVPPFQAPHPDKPESGLASTGLDTRLEHLELEVDRKHKPNGAVRGNSLGLGFRVPLLIASPWSRGGCVYSEVCDHTSPIQFLEKFLSHKTGKKIEETNITPWRRTICGDLTAAFQSAANVEPGLSEFVVRDKFLEAIHRAQFKSLPQGFHALTDQELADLRSHSLGPSLPRQEKGTRKACPLPYELEARGTLNPERNRFQLSLSAKKDQFGEQAAGAPFIVYAKTTDGLTVRHYAIAPGASVEDSWPLDAFPAGQYQLKVHGPNGFYREFRGDAKSPALSLSLSPTSKGDVDLRVSLPKGSPTVEVQVKDLSAVRAQLPPLPMGPTELRQLTILASNSAGWYDLLITAENHPNFAVHFAGKAETGAWTTTDPAMA